MDRSQSITRPPSRDLETRRPKSRWLAFGLAIVFGTLGIHRFYAGKFWTGLLFLLTGGGLGIWWIIDLVMLAMGRFEDAEGRVMGPPRPSSHHRLDAPPRRQADDEDLHALKHKYDGSLESSDDRQTKDEETFVVKTDDGEEVTIDDSEIMGGSLDEEFEKLEREQQEAKSTG